MFGDLEVMREMNVAPLKKVIKAFWKAQGSGDERKSENGIAVSLF